MMRKTYVLMFPLAITGIVVAGFVVGLINPGIPSRSYLVLAIVLVPVFYLLDRLVLRRRVDGPLTDERLQGLAEQAALLSFRVTTAVLMIAGIALLLAFPGDERIGPVAAVAMLAASFQALVFTVVYKLREHKGGA